LSIIRRLAVATAIVFSAAGIAQAQTPTPASNGTAITLPHPGQPIYRQYCASCHDKPEETQAPAKATLEAMSFQSISFALTQGKMQVQAAALDEEQRGQLINYLTGATKRTMEAWSQGMMCDSARRKVDLNAPATVATFGFNERNTRSLTAADAGLTKAQLANLDLAWAIAFPDVTMIRAQGAVVGKTLFLPVAEAAAMYAFDLSDQAKPCVKWVYNTPNGAPLRSSPGFGIIADGRAVLAFSGPCHRSGQPVRDFECFGQSCAVLHQSRLHAVARAGDRRATMAIRYDAGRQAHPRPRRRQDAAGAIGCADLELARR
jgi:mono/diheme cytochrome c family protein